MLLKNHKHEIRRLAVAHYGELTNKIECADLIFKQLNVQHNIFLQGDSLGSSNNTNFSTTDKDNDNAKGNCAEVFKTAGWFND